MTQSLSGGVVGEAGPQAAGISGQLNFSQWLGQKNWIEAFQAGEGHLMEGLKCGANIFGAQAQAQAGDRMKQTTAPGNLAWICKDGSQVGR